MNRRTRATSAALILVLTVVAFAGGGHLVARSFVQNQQTHQLTALADLAVRRAEVSVQEATDALRYLADRHLDGCNPLTLENMRHQIYQRSQIKDIRVANASGAIRCSAFSETLEFDRIWPGRDEMVATWSMDTALFRVDQFGGTALGILHDTQPDRALIAVVTVNSVLLDVLPAELREASEVHIALNNGAEIASFALPERPSDFMGEVIISTPSDRLPLHATIAVSSAGLKNWQGEAYWPLVGLATALGLVLGGIGSRALWTPQNPLVELDRAIASGRFRPFIQPVYNLATDQIVGGEILARWIRADGELVPPSRFIPLAEESGRIEAITWQLLSTALSELGNELSADKTLSLAINIAPTHFGAPDFVEKLREVVHTAGVSYRQISLEITERQPFTDLDAAAERVAELQNLGFRVAIDDVGIGHSGLSHLQQLRANTLKIDKFFVDSVSSDPTAQSIIEMLVRLASRLNMQIVAEGIEEMAQAEALQSFGVSLGQGYLMGRPMPIAAYRAALATSERRHPQPLKRSA